MSARVGKRVLFAVTVYNGLESVPECLRSASATREGDHSVDFLVLDDCSPAPGVRDTLVSLCKELGFTYYRSPRNLGLPRNVNLALLRALDGRYDFAVIANSDVRFAANLVDAFVATMASTASIGSLTAWSNSASIFSLPNEHPDALGADQAAIDLAGVALRCEFRDVAVDIPVAVGFCMCIPTRVLQAVGVMDPVFGRGYCEENDWSLRSKSLGFRVALAPSAFAYHRGGGSMVAAGVLGAGASTVEANERLLDLRFPWYRSQVEAYQRSDTQQDLRQRALRSIIVEGARVRGYEIWVGSPPVAHADRGQVVVTIRDRRAAEGVTAAFRGFTSPLSIDGDPIDSIIRQIGSEPRAVRSGLEERPG